MNDSKLPYVKDGRLYRPDGGVICAVATAAKSKTGWVDWLANERHTSFTFFPARGVWFTAVAEWRELRSGGKHRYWYAHRRMAGRLHHLYLGTPQSITLAKLEQAAGKLAALKISDSAGLPDETKQQWREAERRQPPSSGQWGMFDESED